MVNIKTYISIVLLFFIFISFSNYAYSAQNNNIKVEILSNGVQLKALQRRNVNGKSLSFLPNLETPYSGWAFKQWGNGQLQVAGRFENGMNQGVWMNWSIRGEKVYQVTYKDDIRHGDCIDIESGVAKKIIYVNGVKQ